MRTKRFKLLSLLPAIVLMIMIYMFSAQQGTESSDLSNGITEDIVSAVEKLPFIMLSENQREYWIQVLNYPLRKLSHMSEYALLCILVILPMTVYQVPHRKKYILAVAICVVFACTDEFHQLFVPEREGKFTDVCIDSLGTLIGGMAWRLTERVNR